MPAKRRTLHAVRPESYHRVRNRQHRLLVTFLVLGLMAILAASFM